MFYTIYKTTNLLNQKFYVGKHQTKDLEDGYLGSGKALKQAVVKYGRDNFKKEILHIFQTEAEMNAKEKELVVLSEDSYNLCEGGKGGFGYLNDHSEKHIERTKIGYQKSKYAMVDPEKNRRTGLKVKELKLGIFGLTPEQKRQYSKLAFQGKRHSVETKQKIGSSNSIYRGSKNSQYGTMWITNGVENKKIKKEDLDRYQELGYNKGRKFAAEALR